MFFKDNYFVGVDVGTSALKVVELTYKDQAAYLNNYGYVGLDFGGDGDRGASHEMRKKAYLVALLKKLKLKTKSVFLAMPGYNGLVSFIEFPSMKDEDLAKAIQFEAHKYIPADIDDVSLSWEIVKRGNGSPLDKNKKEKNPSGKMEVLLVAALKKDVAKYESLMQGSDFSLKAIELETFSLMRALSEDYRGTYLIIDIGYKVCNFVLVHEGIVRVNRNIDVGGNEITKAIADSMNISETRAEQMKKSNRDFFHQKELTLVFPGLELIVSEAQRMVRAFHEKKKDQKIDKVILSGGSAGLKGIDLYFQDKLGIHSELGNPWKKVAYDQKLKENIEGMGASYSVAVGLALRGVEEYKRN